MVPNQKKKSGTKCWLIGFVELSLQQFYLTEKNWKRFIIKKLFQWRSWKPDPILDGLAESNYKLRCPFSKHQFAIVLEMEVALKTTFRLWIQYSSCLHWIVLNYCIVSEGFCFDTLYVILIYRDVGRTLFGKSMEFQWFKIPRLQEIFCLFKLKSLLELIPN